ncbi:phosphoadenosine phosphosulfate reductase family protein [Sphingomonas sp. 3-13AW]|uniref:phosphoadenosine phosphosulfate reductase family protein n=1 Tax=Sphingomonas sp. 3-13AW TaxID=3050450 RepID=UPI003BB81231
MIDATTKADDRAASRSAQLEAPSHAPATPGNDVPNIEAGKLRAEWTPEIEALLKAGAWAVWSVSGGKDSSAAMAATIPMLDAIGHPRERRLALHADLGRAEWRSTHAHAQRVCDRLGVPLEVARNPTHDMISRWQRRGDLGRIRYAAYETIRHFGPWSASGLLFCRKELKKVPLDDFKKKLGAPVVSIIGLRREESSGRKNTPVWAQDADLKAKLKQDALIWNPIAAWSTDDVFAFHRDRDIPLHEAYGFGSTRLSCAFCVLGSLNDLSVSAAAEQNQDLYRTQVAMEASYGFSFQPTRWLGDISPSLLGADLRTRLAAAKLLAQRRREIESEIPPVMRFKQGELPIVPDLNMAETMAGIRREVSRLHGIEARYLDAGAIIDKTVEIRRAMIAASERKIAAAARNAAKSQANTYLYA